MFKQIKAAATVALVAIGLSAGVATTAQAGGGYMGQYHGWSGFYIGGHVGSAWKEASWGTLDYIVGFPETGSFDTSGWGGGAHIGYNIQSGNIVFGIEAAYTATDLGATRFSSVDNAVSYTNEINGVFTVGPRLGFASGPFMAYVKGGYALANATVSGFDGTFADSFSKDRNLNGWFVGGGFEWMIAPSIALGVEYNYLDFGSVNVAGITAVNGFDYSITGLDTHMHTVMARISYKFGGERYAPAYGGPLK